MMTDAERKNLEKQGYRLVGSHSAVKICDWTKKAIRNKGVCYKCDFYGIKSWRCVQMTPCLNSCTHRCSWCWRDIERTEAKWKGKVESPKEIVEGCIAAHKKLLCGFKGNNEIDKHIYLEAEKPMHFAISLSGEPCLYPKLPELVCELSKRKITSFIVTNGTNPAMLKKLAASKNQPTQIYLTLPAPDKQTYKIACNPLINPETGWKNILKSLALLKKFKRSAIRLTLAKEINMTNPEGYAKLIAKANPNFVELKGYMSIGCSVERLGPRFMPSHTEIIEFAEKIANATGEISKAAKMKIIDSKERSNVALIMRKDNKKRKLF